MRCFIAAVFLLGALMCPRNLEALDCPSGPFYPGSWQRAIDGDDIPEESQRRDAEARATLELLERTPIVFRGRIGSARYLSDPRKTNTPTSLLVFDHVEVLKGRLPATSSDRKAFIIGAEWCDHSCNGRTAMIVPRGETVVIAARPNRFADPSKAVDAITKRLIYKGRIDAVLGMCFGGPLPPMALEILNAPDDEIARLKREYLPRR
jgi:hypothetical protein